MADTTPPIVTITFPQNDSTVRGTVTLTAVASDDSGAPPSVRFLLGSTVLGTATLSNGVYSLAGVNTKLVDNGAYVLRAVATDGSGNSSSAEHTALVDNSTAPTTTPPGVYFAGKALALPSGIDRLYHGATLLLGSSPSLPPSTGGGGGVVTPPPTGAPTRVASYGPNGSNWDARTPWVGAPTSAYISSGGGSEEVDPTWAAIGAAITRAFSAPNPDGMFRVLVRPGELPGFGGGSGSTPVLQNLGKLGRKWRVVIAPRDGVFSVSFSDSIRLNNIKGISFVGFSPSGPDHVEVDGGVNLLDANGKEIPNSSPNLVSSRGVAITNSADSSWAWSKLSHFNLTANGGGNIDGIDLIELIARDNAVSNTDRSSGRNADGGYMRNVTFQGLWMGARWRNDRGAHLDTFQASGNSAQFSNFTFLNSYFNGVSNAVLIGVGDGIEPVNSMNNPFIDHCALVGGLQAANHLYPFKGGQLSDPYQPPAIPLVDGPVALNGLPYRARVRDSLISGSVKWKFHTVENTRFRVAPPTPTSGTPIIDSSLFTTRESFESYGIDHTPTIADMRNMWRW